MMALGAPPDWAMVDDDNYYYRKRPCISRTFFHKIEAKNRGCGLSMDTSMFGVLKNLLNIHKTS